MPKKLSATDLSTAPIDDRWTLDKLRRAGYSMEWDRPCRTCGDQIEAYRHEKTQRLLILDEAVLSVHSCTRG
jgi:hypothetical protein